MSFLYWLDLIGVAVFAISGALAAGRKELDLIGVVVLAFVTAIGGGTLRDLLLDRHPIFWLADPVYIAVITSAALATVAYGRWRLARVASRAASNASSSVRRSEHALLVADALGLALFSIVGAQVAERAGSPVLACILLGTMTGCAGGVMRDVLANEIPLLMRRERLYASCAIVGIVVYFFARRVDASAELAAMLGMVVVATMRLVSIWRRWELPVFRLPDDRGS